MASFNVSILFETPPNNLLLPASLPITAALSLLQKAIIYKLKLLNKQLNSKVF
jgi:hypothetical protein